MIWIVLLGIVAYIFFGGLCGGYCFKTKNDRCEKCRKRDAGDRWSYCYSDHGMAAFFIAAAWPVVSIAFGGMLLTQYLLELPDRRREKREAAEKKSREAIEYLESQGIHADWTKL